MKSVRSMFNCLRNLLLRQVRRVREQLPGTMQQVPYNLLWITFLFTIVKLFVVLPYHDRHELFLVFKLISIFNCLSVAALLLFIPKIVPALARLAVVMMSVFLILRAMMLPEHLNFLTIQHIYITIMIAFYAINHYWGIGVSLSLATFVTVYVYQFSDRLDEFTLLPSTLPVEIGLINITLNFIMIGVLHYYYYRTLIRVVADVGELNLKLSDSLRVKNNFLSVMSHELRTPLNSVVGTAHLLADDVVSEKQRQNLENLKLSAESLTILINDILDYSKMDTDRTRLEHSPFSIQEISERVFNVLKKRAEEKALNFVVQVDESVKALRVLGDPSRLTQMLYNILGNAIKFTNRGEVRLHVTLADKQIPLNSENPRAVIIFTVSDTGVGIDASQHQVIFEPFMQVASSSISRQYGGVGLGLTIVKHLVNLHGGKIYLESGLGSGSTFTMEILYDLVPNQTMNTNELKGAVEQQATHSPERKTEIEMSKLRLLMAEDNQLNILFMKQMLKKWGISAEFANDGEEVINLFKAGETYDLILMDIHMPKVSGLEATTFIRQLEQQDPSRPRVHIIALTASVSDRFTDSLSELGFDDYVRKPFRPDDLQDKIKKILEQVN